MNSYSNLPGPWPRVITGEEELSLCANPPKEDPAVEANPPTKAELGALARAEVLTKEWQEAVDEVCRLENARDDTSPIVFDLSPPFVHVEKKGGPTLEKIEQARAEMESRRILLEQARIKATNLQVERAHRTRLWRIEHE